MRREAPFVFCTGSGPKNGRRLIDMKIHPFYNESKWMQPTPGHPRKKEEVICMRSITVQRLAEFTEQDYEFTFGITRKQFAQMLEALNAAYCKEHRRRPHFTKITMQDKLVLTLLYRREYRSMENIAAEYGVSRDTIADNIHWVERALLNANLLQNSVTCVYKTN